MLELPATLVDWGARSVRTSAVSAALSKLSVLLENYSPEVLLIEDCGASVSHGTLRRKRLLESIFDFAVEKGVAARRISKQRVRKLFLSFEAVTRRQIALVVAEILPDLAPYVPRIRKPWMSEDYSAAIFDAAALALAYFALRRNRAGRASIPLLSAPIEKDAFTKISSGSGH